MAGDQQRFLWPDGQPFDQDRCLFAPAPEQIGSVTIASSSLQQNRVWLKALSRLGLPFRHTMGYLGDAGLACFECERDPGRLVRREVLIFSEAANLFTRSTGGTFEFLWKDPLDRLLFRYEDTLPATVPADHIFHLLKAAEGAWTNWLLEEAKQTLERGGNVTFPVLGQGPIRLSPNEIGWGTAAMQRGDVDYFTADKSMIEVHPGYVGQSRGLKPIQVAHSSVANAQTLVRLLAEVLDLPARS